MNVLSLQAKYAIVTVPPNLQQSISFEPNLPPSKTHLLQRLPMGSCIKAEVWFKTPFWREKGNVKTQLNIEYRGNHSP